MSLLLDVAAQRTYDALKMRPGARSRYSDARDASLLRAITARIYQLIDAYQITEHRSPNGRVYVFWAEIAVEVDKGAFDDMLDQL